MFFFRATLPWLHTYLNELTSFPNSKYDDQVNSTVFALAWSTLEPISVWTDEGVRNLEKFTAGMVFPHIYGPNRRNR